MHFATNVNNCRLHSWARKPFKVKIHSKEKALVLGEWPLPSRNDSWRNRQSYFHRSVLPCLKKYVRKLVLLCWLLCYSRHKCMFHRYIIIVLNVKELYCRSNCNKNCLQLHWLTTLCLQFSFTTTPPQKQVPLIYITKRRPFQSHWCGLNSRNF